MFTQAVNLLERSIVQCLGLRKLAFALALSFCVEVHASPPSPPRDEIYDLAKLVVPTQSAATFDRYAAALHDSVTVKVNGKGVASNKFAWLTLERRRLGKVDRNVLGHVVGGDGSILVSDRVDDRSGLPTEKGVVFDARYQTRAVRYEVGRDNLIHAIRIIQADGVLASQ